MKKIIACVLSLFVGVGLFAQTPRVAVADFDIDPGISRQEADVVYELFTAQLASTKKVTVSDRVNLDKIMAEMRFQASDWSNKDKTASMGRVINATALIRGRLMKMNNWIYWTATMLDLNTARVMYAASVRISDLGQTWDILSVFCNQLVGKVGTQTVSPEVMTNIAVATFDVQGGITTQESAIITELFIASLVQTGKVNVIDRTNFDKIIAEMKFQASDWSDRNKTASIGRVLNAQNVIRGQLMKLGNTIYWVTTVLDVNTAEILSSSRQQLNSLEEIWVRQNNNRQNESLLFKTSNEIVAQLPPPNFFVGRWKASYTPRYYSRWDRPPDIELVIILDIKPNGTIVVERYDTVTVTHYVTTHTFSDNEHRNSWGSQNQNGSGTGIYTIEKSGSNGLIMNFSLSLKGINSGIPTSTKDRGFLSFSEPNVFRLGSFSGNSALSAGYLIWKENGKTTNEFFEQYFNGDAGITYKGFTRLK
jgi:TolB-like protein